MKRQTNREKMLKIDPSIKSNNIVYRNASKEEQKTIKSKPKKILSIVDNSKKISYSTTIQIRNFKPVKRYLSLSDDVSYLLKGYEEIARIDPLYLGETIYIVGGGPSLKNFDMSSLKGKRVIAINKAFLHLPFADFLYWQDIDFFVEFEKQIRQFKGFKVTNKPTPVSNDIINLVDTGKSGLELDSHGLRNGGNSGYGAINLAYHLGARTIVLLGFDMKNEKDKTHWHDGYSTRVADDKIFLNSMLPNFESLVEPLEKRKVKIYNASMESRITCFEKINLHQILDL